MAWLVLLAFTAVLVACNADDRVAAAIPTGAVASVETPTAPTVPTPPAPTVTVAPLPTTTRSATLTAQPSATATPDVTDTTTPTGTATTMPSSTPTPSPPAATLTLTTVPLSPTGTVEGAPTSTAAPPSDGLVQPPYAPSPCSSRYPCNDDVAGWERRIRVPAGYRDRYFGRVEGNPTSITFGPDGRLYIALLQGAIVAMDTAGQVSPYAGGLNTPTGIAFRPGTGELYISSRLRSDSYGGEAQISIIQGGAPRQLVGGLPCCYAGMHGAHGIAFGPDGFGYIGVGGRSDHGDIPDGSNRQDELHSLEASVLRFSPDGSFIEPYARGFRNPYDIAWDANGQLYATDNAPDYGPPDELHRVIPGGQHGYPWFDCGACFQPPADVQIVPPIYNFPPHSSPTGITAYLADQFPGSYDHLFVTLWSSFPGAQKVMRFGPGGAGAADFALGFAQPIDVAVGPDGSLYVADHATGIIFQISYAG